MILAIFLPLVTHSHHPSTQPLYFSLSSPSSPTGSLSRDSTSLPHSKNTLQKWTLATPAQEPRRGYWSCAVLYPQTFLVIRRSINSTTSYDPLCSISVLRFIDTFTDNQLQCEVGNTSPHNLPVQTELHVALKILPVSSFMRKWVWLPVQNRAVIIPLHSTELTASLLEDV